MYIVLLNNVHIHLDPDRKCVLGTLAVSALFEFAYALIAYKIAVILTK